MKRKEAIKQIKEGKIQVCNDLLPSTKKIKKFLKEAFPDEETEDDLDYKYWFTQGKRSLNADNTPGDLPIINLSTITKRKKTKLSQLEKQFSDLAKDVSELRQTLAKDVEVDVEDVEREIYTTGKKWFKDESYPNWLMCFDYENNKYYGMDIHGNWHCKEDDIRQPFSHEKETTDQEVQAALENEAKKRGFVEGVYFTDRNKETYLISKDLSKGYSFDNNKLYLYGWEIFCDGIWAEIQQEKIKEDEIDWSVPQLLVSSGNNETVYFYNCEMEDKNITVYSVSNSIYFKYPNVFKRQSKSLFKPFKGELTIK